MKKLNKIEGWSLLLGALTAFLLFLGCATTQVRPEPFTEFSTSIQELRTGANEALKLNVEHNRKRFINQTAEASLNPEGADDIINLMIQRGDSQNPFSWKMDRTPLFLMSRQFRDGVYNLNTTLVAYAELLKDLASSSLVSKKHFDAMAKDLNASLAAVASDLEFTGAGRKLSIFSAAAAGAAHAYIENHRHSLLRKAMEENQKNIEAIAMHLQKAMGITADNLRNNYDSRSQLLARQLTPGAGGDRANRRKKVKEFIKLNEEFIIRLSALETLHNAYRALPNAHRELIIALEQPNLNLTSIQELYVNGKHLYDLYKEIAPPAAIKK